MDQRVKDLFTRALRSGFFQQGRGYLSVTEAGDGGETGDCCLGVLCKLAVLEGVIPNPQTTTRGNSADGNLKTILRFHNDENDRNGSTAFLPENVMEWAGFGDDNGAMRTAYINDGETHWSLVSMNDAGVPFDKIADVIDEQF